MKKQLIITLIALQSPFLVYGFANNFESTSLEESLFDTLDTSNRVLANLPYSACEYDPKKLADNFCRLVSLEVGSRIFNDLYKSPDIIEKINPKKIDSTKANNIAINYRIGTQEKERDVWSVPTVSQLEWMVDNNLISPQRGEYLWAKNPAGGFKKVFYLSAGSTSDANSNTASLYRLANQSTPDGCTEGIDCNLFNEIKPFFVRVSRSNVVHSMGYTIIGQNSSGNNIFSSEGYSEQTRLFQYDWPSNLSKVIFLYCTQGIYGCGQGRVEFPPVNWSYAKPTFCVYSKGTVLSTWIDWKQVAKPEDC